MSFSVLLVSQSQSMPGESRIFPLELTNVICLSIALSMAGLRFWVRFAMLKSRGLDDLLLIVAVIFTILLSASCYLSDKLGLGNQTWQLTSVDSAQKIEIASNITKAVYGCYFAYPTAIIFTKFSIMATYLRVFPPGHLRRSTVALSVLAVVFWVASIFAIIFTCIPLQAAWDQRVVGRCYDILNFFVISSSFHILLDVLLCILPIPIIWSLSMPKTQRLILIALLCGGALACVSSILRLIHLRQVIDNIYVRTISIIEWSIIEVDAGIICASMAALRPLCKLLTLPYFSNGLNKRDDMTTSSVPNFDEIFDPPQPFIIHDTDQNTLKPRAVTHEYLKPKFLTHGTSTNRASMPELPLPVAKSGFISFAEFRDKENGLDINKSSMRQGDFRKTWNNNRFNSNISPEHTHRPSLNYSRCHSVNYSTHICHQLAPHPTHSRLHNFPKIDKSFQGEYSNRNMTDNEDSDITSHDRNLQPAIFLLDDSDEENIPEPKDKNYRNSAPALSPIKQRLRSSPPFNLHRASYMWPLDNIRRL
ncbi:putative 50s ribosomal protein l36e [Golovinomyces cichoracearum]|uniref:Putative 50s ribosomal protein l36e n=1 Tax=Golovinomyces cichoracearum TaxID=62708 RepID=A0A420IX60_9PEZI|nr:putative 50s ribosomal protein l36e [Golovinomyces cichoracearum]